MPLVSSNLTASLALVASALLGSFTSYGVVHVPCFRRDEILIPDLPPLHLSSFGFISSSSRSFTHSSSSQRLFFRISSSSPSSRLIAGFVMMVDPHHAHSCSSLEALRDNSLLSLHHFVLPVSSKYPKPHGNFISSFRRLSITSLHHPRWPSH